MKLNHEYITKYIEGRLTENLGFFVADVCSFSGISVIIWGRITINLDWTTAITITITIHHRVMKRCCQIANNSKLSSSCLSLFSQILLMFPVLASINTEDICQFESAFGLSYSAKSTPFLAILHPHFCRTVSVLLPSMTPHGQVAAIGKSLFFPPWDPTFLPYSGGTSSPLWNPSLAVLVGTVGGMMHAWSFSYSFNTYRLVSFTVGLLTLYCRTFFSANTSSVHFQSFITQLYSILRFASCASTAIACLTSLLNLQTHDESLFSQVRWS